MYTGSDTGIYKISRKARDENRLPCQRIMAASPSALTLTQKGRLSLRHGKPDRNHVRRLPSKPCQPAVRHLHDSLTGCIIDYR